MRKTSSGVDEIGMLCPMPLSNSSIDISVTTLHHSDPSSISAGVLLPLLLHLPLPLLVLCVELSDGSGDDSGEGESGGGDVS